MVFLLLFLCCLSFPCVAKELPVKITGKPNPQILATEAWRALREIGFVRGTPPPRYQMNAYYDEPNRFRLDILLPEGNQCLMAHHFFDRRHGRWYLSVEEDKNVGMNNINLRNRDYLSKLLDFYDAPTAFPLIVKPEEARQAYSLLCAATTTAEQWRVQPNPPLRLAIPRTPFRDDEPRTREAFIRIVSTFPSEARYIGLTRVNETDQVCWVQAEDRFSLFLLQTTNGKTAITDWYANIRTADRPKAGQRVCTIPVQQTAMGGRLTLGQLIEQQPQAQALLSMFRLAAMQNLNEVMSYCAGSISGKDLQQWWPSFYEASYEASRSKRDLLQFTVEPQPNGRYIINYPTKHGERSLQCKLVDARFQIVALQGLTRPVATPVRDTTATRMVTLVRTALKQVDQQNGIDYIEYRHDDPLAQQREFCHLSNWAAYRWQPGWLVHRKSGQMEELLVVERIGDQYRMFRVGFTKGISHISYIEMIDCQGGRHGCQNDPLHRSDIEDLIRGFGGTTTIVRQQI